MDHNERTESTHPPPPPLYRAPMSRKQKATATDSDGTETCIPSFRCLYYYFSVINQLDNIFIRISNIYLHLPMLTVISTYIKPCSDRFPPHRWRDVDILRIFGFWRSFSVSAMLKKHWFHNKTHFPIDGSRFIVCGSPRLLPVSQASCCPLWITGLGMSLSYIVVKTWEEQSHCVSDAAGFSFTAIHNE